MALALASLQPSAQTVFRNGFEPPCDPLLDADVDRLDDCIEAALGTDRLDADTDDDGLHDGDEVLGTVDGLDLPELGGTL